MRQLLRQRRLRCRLIGNRSSFITTVTDSKVLKAFIAFENRRRWLFPDVHSEDQPTALIMSSQVRRYEQFLYAIKLTTIPRDDDDPVLAQLSAATLLAVNPNTRTLPVFRSAEDTRLVVEIYSRLPVLTSRSATSTTQA